MTMLRTFIVGVIAAVAGSKLKKAYDEGKLQPYIDKAKPYVDDAIGDALLGGADARRSLGEKQDVLTSPRELAPAPAASSKATKRS